MNEQMLSTIDQCLLLIRQLQNQIEDNQKSFARCITGDINDAYQKQTRVALEYCAKLKNQLSQLQASETAKAIATMQ